MMQILVNETFDVIAYAYTGGFPGSFEVDTIPKDNPLSYRYINKTFVKNPDYKPPEPMPEPMDTLALAISDVDAQREADKLANQLAIAELAETLLTGGANNG